MDENGICEQTYYRWQRAIRQETYTEMTSGRQFPASPPSDTDVSFVEVPMQKIPSVLAPVDRRTAPAVIKTAAFTIEIADSISDRLLSAILREASHV